MPDYGFTSVCHIRSPVNTAQPLRSLARKPSQASCKVPSFWINQPDRTDARITVRAVKASSVGAMIVSASLRRALLAPPAPKRTAVDCRAIACPLYHFDVFREPDGSLQPSKRQRPKKDSRPDVSANHHRPTTPGRWERRI